VDFLYSAGSMLNSSNAPCGAAVSPLSPRKREPKASYLTKISVCTLMFFSACCGAWCQAPADQAAPAAPPAAPAVAPASAQPAAFAIGDLRPILANVKTAVANLSVSRWKASNEIRTTTQQDVVSIQHDLDDILPDLLTQAEAPPKNGQTTLQPFFAVFRNLDALYDVLLRVSGTAAFAGTPGDAENTEDARAGLEQGRAKLGTWLLQSIGAQDAQVAHFLAAPPPPPAAPPPPPKVVINDGPTPPAPKTKKKKPATPAPQSSTPPSTPQ
jgi:hypothetical protein